MLETATLDPPARSPPRITPPRHCLQPLHQMEDEMLPICHPCCREMRCEKNGIAVVSGNGLFHGDLYKCPTCKAMVIAGFGLKPIREGWEPDFALVVATEENYGTVVRVQE